MRAILGDNYCITLKYCGIGRVAKPFLAVAQPGGTGKKPSCFPDLTLALICASRGFLATNLPLVPGPPPTSGRGPRGCPFAAPPTRAVLWP